MTSNPEPLKTSIVIPVYNGAHSIGRLVDELITRLSPVFRIEIVLVNDCSPDNSEEVCIGITKKHPDFVSFYSLAMNVGEHNAVMAGLNKATGDYAIIVDDDFQNPVSEVEKVISYMISHDYDVVYTWYKQKKHSWFRNLGSRFNDKVANMMLKKPRNLYLSSFKIINRFLIDEVIKYNLPYPYIDGLILRTTSNIGKIEVSHNIREEGKSNYTLSKLVSLWMNMFTNFSILPLRLSILAGFIFSIIGFLIGIDAIIEKIYNPQVPLGYTFLVVVISIYAGVQLIAIGMVGEYLGRLFMSQNKKPQYSIRKSFNLRTPDGQK
ncbi:MAG TPA: glycosyltransferase [Prolixibacteraceae bacterium]|jgi:undecaprenyl-phosphate 4-deoxy-4-formamido-L-arabinose transferase|nr:glycosyltransferase [Prolixibacteraceae bacterium]